ncbi:MAG: DUF1559 domain-containing protein [Gemmataceae bacterium]|nr:DUF1559 domain-containing protein [Gemmataceae bacterium]
MYRPCSRAGTSLVEVIVVIAILGVLLGLIVAAVQRVRDTAARHSCADNLRQIGIALHQYHTAHGVFPPGVVHPALRPGLPRLYGPDTDPYPLMNWHTRLLPYIEQGALWRQTQQAYAQDRYAINVPPHVGHITPIPLFLCPADTSRTLPGVALEQTAATTSYLGISGTNDYLQDGMLYLDSRVRLVAVLDGTSNTLMAGERPPTLDLRYGRWYGGWGPWGVGNAFLGVREISVPSDGDYDCSGRAYEFRPGQLQDPCSTFHFWSLHGGGASFLFADGSVRFLPYSAAQLLPALATRAGGEPRTLPE